MSWTDERVDILKKLWAEGLSASQIANRLGGVTRNAVIGKVHRLGLSGRTTTSRVKTQRPRRRAAPRAAGGGVHTFRTHGNVALKAYYEADPEAEIEAAPATVEELVIPIAERASILSLKESMCRWPIGDPGDAEFHFCGRDSGQGTPYCEYHARVAYQPPNSRRRERRSATG